MLKILRGYHGASNVREIFKISQTFALSMQLIEKQLFIHFLNESSKFSERKFPFHTDNGCGDAEFTVACARNVATD